MIKQVTAAIKNRKARREFKYLLDREGARQDSIDILIPIRDRPIEHLIKCIESFDRNDTGIDVQVTLLDYGSTPSNLKNYRNLAEKFKGRLLEYKNPTRNWNKSKCLNLGIAHSGSKFLMVLDADMILQKGFIELSLKTIREQPYSIINSQVYDMKKDDKVSFYNPHERYQVRKTDFNNITTAINFTWTLAYKYIGGFNENFEIWGGEDDDVFLRLRRLGLQQVSLHDQVVVLHQWHPSLIEHREDLKEILAKADKTLKASRLIRQSFLGQYEQNDVKFI